MEKTAYLNEVFNQGLYYFPYCTDYLKYGIYNLPVNLAIEKRYIQYNRFDMVKWIVLDVDRGFDYLAELDWDFLPTPNLQVRNPKNNHVHLFFGLKSPVCTTNVARLKPIQYLSAIERGLIYKFNSDKNFSGLISKNPNNPYWDTVIYREEFYELFELADCVDLTIKKEYSLKEEYGFSRNCAIFDIVRKWAYKACWDFGKIDSFEKEVFRQCEEVNGHFLNPLFSPELKSIAKSISKYCFNVIKKQSAEDRKRFIERTHSSELQSERGKLKSGHFKCDRNAVLAAWNSGEYKNKTALAKAFNISRMTVFNYLNSIDDSVDDEKI